MIRWYIRFDSLLPVIVIGVFFGKRLYDGLYSYLVIRKNRVQPQHKGKCVFVDLA